jgi:RNA polymerase sigma-70 factor (ECF subfamily)
VTRFSEQDDAELLVYVLNGNHSAYAELVRRHNRGAYVVAYRFVGEREEAQDIVQTAFLKLWKRPGMWNPEMDSLFTTWFYRVVVNLCLDWCKKRKPLLSPQLTEVCIIEQATEISQEDCLLLTEQQVQLEAQMMALPVRQRTAINLCYATGMSNKQAAEVMGISLRAFQSLVMRAKSSIRKNLENLS